MKKIVLWICLTTLAFARTENDVALTWGHNSFNDDEILFGSAAFYGIRAGTTIDDTYGAQVGYEQTRAANCQGLTLRRYYVNGVVQTRLENGLTPYALATLGYETSNKDYRPSQPFLGLGGGLKYRFSNNANVFLETRALKSMDTEDVTWATTLGLGYTFSTAPILKDIDVPLVAKTKSAVTKINVVRVAPQRVVQHTTKTHNVFRKKEISRVVKRKKKSIKRRVGTGYYVQITALTSSSPTPYVKRLKRHGFTNVSVKRRSGKTFVVVGPYHDKKSAKRALPSLGKVSRGAFIKRF